MKTNVSTPPYVIAGRGYYCPVQLTVDALSGKWKPMIVWHLVLHDRMRYGEMKTALRTITHKMLAQSLRELESDGLVTRTVYDVVPPKVEYSLSPKGETLRGLFVSMREFGETYKAA